MGLNPQYILAPSLQEYFIDKDDGTPLTNGLVYFWADNARTEPKPVYEISGTPPNYSYNVLPNPVLLSSVGTFQDASGNDIVPYYFPYDDAGNVQNYFVQVTDMNGVLQFTREGWPNFTEADSTISESSVNYIPNGQFLLNNAGTGKALSTTSTANGSQTVNTSFSYPGLATVDIWQIAPGGWTFERTHGSTASDIVQFQQSTSFATNPSGSPRYSANLIRSQASSDSITQIAVKFRDVNTFQGEVVYFSFNGISNAGALNGININILQYYGTGTNSPSNTNQQNISSVIFSTSLQQFVVAIDFTQGALQTQGKTIGNNNDDYVEFVIALPTASTYNVNVTDFFLSLEPITTTTPFPTKTNGQFVLEAVSNTAPTTNAESSAYYAEDGSNLYLPMIMTSSGFTYDYSQIGIVIGKLSTTPGLNELPLNGASYLFSGYSAVGIPYYRLGNFLIANSPTANTPLFGTGANYATASVDSASVLYLVMNTSGGVTAPTSSSAAITIGGSDPTYTVTVASVPAAGAYFTFVTNPSSPISYYVWFQVGGSADPAPIPGYIGIKVVLVGGDTTATTTTKIIKAINAYQFVLPDYRGYFIRSLDTGASVDPDAASRSLAALGLTGAYIGSTEAAAFLSHTHTGTAAAHTNTTFAGSGAVSGYNASVGSSTPLTVTNANTGGNETRPINFAVSWFIKY